MADQRLVFHHLNHSQSQRILWLLEELKVPYELKLHYRCAEGYQKGRGPDTLKDVHQLGKSPTLVTPEGRVIVETSAIATYLIKNYDSEKNFQGDGSPRNDDIRDEMLTSFAGASLGTIMAIEMVFDALAAKSPFFIRFLFNGIHSIIHKQFTRAEFDKFLTFLTDELGDQEWFMGSKLGRADFMMSWPFDFCVQRKYIDLSQWPKLQKWHARCQAREAWKESLNKGNGYDLVHGLM